MRLLNFGCPSVTSSRREKTTGMESKICTLTRGTADGVSISQENGKKKKKNSRSQLLSYEKNA